MDGYNDAGVTTVGAYLRELSLTVWNEAKAFSGKRPFGNSGWQYDIYKALIEAGIVPGELDEEGFVAEIETEVADVVILGCISGTWG